METKTCIKCEKEKPVDCFQFRKDTGNYTGRCKECRKQYDKQYSTKNRDKINKRLLSYYENRSKNLQTKICSKCGEEKPIKSFNKRRSQCKVCEKVNIQKYYRTHKHVSKSYRMNNLEKVRKTRIKRHKTRMTEDPIYALSCKIRTSLLRWLSHTGFNKENRTQEIVGCSWKCLNEHLGEKFEGSHIDHILPLEKFEDIIPENVFVRLLWNYKNLQRLSGEQNVRKSCRLPIDWKERLRSLGKDLSIDVSEIILRLQENITLDEVFWDNDKRILVNRNITEVKIDRPDLHICEIK